MDSAKPAYYQDFMRSEAARIEYWDYKLEGWEAFRDAQPNRVHHALVELERANCASFSPTTWTVCCYASTLKTNLTLADVGFGGVTLTGPLRLIADIEQATPHEPFRLLVKVLGAKTSPKQSCAQWGAP